MNTLQEAIWNQFGASIDMLLNIVSSCNDDYFQSQKRFYYLTYHTAVFLDYYSTLPPGNFAPILPFTQMEENVRPAESLGDFIPNKSYTKQELINYIELSRAKCKMLIQNLSDDSPRFIEGDDEHDMNYSLVEILLYNVRHTQHHVGQLNILIRQNLDKHLEWSFRVGDIKTLT